MNKKIYCIACERMTVLQGSNFDRHLSGTWDDGVWCFGEFESSAPPELDMSDEWLESLPVPTEDELLIMELNAEELARDLELA